MDFKKAWKEQQAEKTLKDEQAFWDDRAQEFNEIIKQRRKEDEVVKFLKEKGAIFKGARVLDIGCGAGRYSKIFLKLGCQVTGIDISPYMIDFSKENAADFDKKNFFFKVVSWEDVDLQAEGWGKAFDLVFASMSPAINGPEALEKMIDATKGYCFMSSHLYKKEMLGEELKIALNRKGSKVSHRQNLYYAFNILWEMGYYPEFLHYNYHHTKIWKEEKAVNYYKQMFKAEDEKTETLIREYIGKKNINGQVKDTIDSKKGWLFWSVRDLENIK